jgi:hypothetical protein
VKPRQAAKWGALEWRRRSHRQKDQLNGHYHGLATGEAFNVGGKTDTLIRSNGHNDFNAECKLSSGMAKWRCEERSTNSKRPGDEGSEVVVTVLVFNLSPP